MTKDPHRLRVAVADPSNFGQATLCDLLADEGVRDLVKFADGRELIAALLKDQFDLIVIDDDLPAISASELVHLAKNTPCSLPLFIAVQSVVTREEVSFLRESGVSGIVLKPVAPKRFSAVFRSLFRAGRVASLAA